MTGRDDVNATLAKSVLAYWQERTGTEPRSESVKAAYLKRIQARLAEGWSALELTLCVDAALVDDFYLSHNYHKQPAVIWRNAERVQSLLGRARKLEPRQVEAPLPPEEVKAAERQRDEWLADFRKGR